MINPSLGSGINKKYLKAGQRISGTTRDTIKETMNLFLTYFISVFYFDDIKNTYAGNKAFIVNRVGDFGFLSALMLLFVEIGHGGFSYDAIFFNLSLIDTPMLSLIALLLFVGAMGKSAQLPLFVWLPDAMAGPTPVSALIHAATMVTAGIYMVARFAPLYNVVDDVSLFIAYIGALSALLAAIVATRQYDIKKILAYSTISQLGFMFMALGVGAYSTALFHMFTHAFFKGVTGDLRTLLPFNLNHTHSTITVST